MKEFLAGKGGAVAMLLGGLVAIWLTAILGKYLPDDLKTLLLAGEATLVTFVLSMMKSLLSPAATTTTIKMTTPAEEDTKP